MRGEIGIKLIDSMGSDLTVANAARVSFGKHKHRFDEKDARLIKYLGKHKHISPFGHCFASFHVRAPIFVARQLVKHKFLRWNEVSRRYVSDEPEFYQPSLREASPDKKQGSGADMGYDVHIHNSFVQHELHSVKLYDYLLNRGVCEEQARMVLPQNLMTEWYWSGSLDAFADMCNLRCKEDTQKETRKVANEIARVMQYQFPESWRALCHD